MDDEVIVGIPVSPEVAKLLQDEVRARAVGRLVTDLVHPNSPGTDPLGLLIGEIKADARADGLGDLDIDAELSEYNAERRI